MMTDDRTLASVLRDAQSAPGKPPAFDAVVERGPRRRRLRATPFAVAAIAFAGLVMIGAPPPASEPSLVLVMPPSTDWLAEPPGVERLRTVPHFATQGDLDVFN